MRLISALLLPSLLATASAVAADTPLPSPVTVDMLPAISPPPPKRPLSPEVQRSRDLKAAAKQARTFAPARYTTLKYRKRADRRTFSRELRSYVADTWPDRGRGNRTSRYHESLEELPGGEYV